MKDPKDFERAIKKLARKISPAIQRVHLVITGRVNAWRPVTDLALCNKQFLFELPSRIKKNETNNEEELSPDDEILGSEDKQSDKKDVTENAGFKVYSLTDLSSDQITTFVSGKGIKNTSEFLDDVERHDAWAYTTRPQDLEDIVELWNENKKVGTRLELMRYSIERRLNERDQDRADSELITAEKVRDGARLIAAAATLMQESTIRVPDGSNNTGSVLKLVDNDWGAPKLFECLENQLCGDYLRDSRSNRGIFLLVYRGKQKSWKIPNGNQKANFYELVEALQNLWEKISSNYPDIEQIEVIGIDLTKRSMRPVQKSK